MLDSGAEADTYKVLREEGALPPAAAAPVSSEGAPRPTPGPARRRQAMLGDWSRELELKVENYGAPTARAMHYSLCGRRTSAPGRACTASSSSLDQAGTPNVGGGSGSGLVQERPCR